MAKVKHTDRKEKPKTLPKAIKPYQCLSCRKEFTQKSNYARHLGLIHGSTPKGDPIDPATLAKFSAYAKRGKRQPKSDETQLALSDGPANYPKPDVPDQVLAGPPKEKPKKEKKKSALPRPQKESSTPKVAVTEESGVEVTARKPTRPQLPVSRKIRPQLEFVTMPRRTAEETPRPKRKMEMAPSILAKRVAASRAQSSRQVAETLAEKYAMPSTERRQNENIIRGMRAAERNLCMQIRKMLPMRRTPDDVDQFLDELEAECQRADEHDSDEFV